MFGTYLEFNAMLTDRFAPESKEHIPSSNEDFVFQESVENLQCEPPVGDGSQASDHEMSDWKPYTQAFSSARSWFLKTRQPAGV